MKIFYHNYESPKPDFRMPELVRSRYLSLPGNRQKKIYKLNVKDWLLDASIVAQNSFWRQDPRDEWTAYRAGQIRLVKPNTYLEECQDCCDQVCGWMIYFRHGESAGLEELFSDAGSVRVIDYNEEIMERGKKIAISGSRDGSAAYCEVQLLFWEILTLLRGTVQKDSARTQSGTFSENVDHYLKHHLTSRVSRQELAAALNVSVSTLSHRYFAERGISPMQRHLELRLKQAASIMCSGVTLQSAAEALAFSCASHLAKAFKVHFGVTISDYRKRDAGK